ncbi:tektin-1 [Diretmus argenteus]
MSLLDGRPQQAGGTNLMHIETMRSHSERLTAESKRLIEESDKASKRLQQHANKKLDQRIQDIQFFRKELERNLEELVVEIDVLILCKSRVEKALEACTEPLRVTTLCLEERMKHPAGDRVNDEVARELLKEREVIEGVASLLQRTLEQMTEQIRLNRSAKYHLEKDLKDKHEAQCIDDSCALMTNRSLSNHQKPKDTDTALPSVTVSPEEWEGFSDVNMAKAQREKSNSLSLRALVESLLEQTAADMQTQVQVTTSAFQRNVHRTRTTKAHMEDQLAKVVLEVGSQQRNMEALQVAIAEKEIPLRVAQARLSTRGQRPNKEQCHDQAQSHLLSEVQQLTNHISKMQEAAGQSQVKQRRLIRCQLELQENIELKANTLYIDEVICTQLREPVVIHRF